MADIRRPAPKTLTAAQRLMLAQSARAILASIASRKAQEAKTEKPTGDQIKTRNNPDFGDTEGG